MKKKLLTAALCLTIVATMAQNNDYPTTGSPTIYDYSPMIFLKRNTAVGGFTQGIQTQLQDGTNNWYFGALYGERWIVSKGDYQDAKLTILNNGDVGIGTSTIDNAQSWNRVLHVYGTYHSKLLVTEGSGVKVGIFSHNGYNGKIGTESNHNLTLTAGYWNDVMTLTTQGNVGIGTLTPNEKLSVNGKIRAQEIKVENTNWPDYVFQKDYKLPSLAETEKHIQEKGHLPGIPSAEEVHKNGLNVGEMNAKLLEKIEELTLRLIEQQKQLDKQAKQIEILLKPNEKN